MRTYRFFCSCSDVVKRSFRGGKSMLYACIACACWSASLQAQAIQKIYAHPAGAFFTAQDLCSDVVLEAYYLTGVIQGDKPQPFVIKTGPTGAVIWSKTFSQSGTGSYFAGGNSIRSTSDHGLIIGAVQEQNSIEIGGALIKTSTTGAVEWTKTASCLWRSSAVCADEENLYYSAEGKGVPWVYLGKFSNAGAEIWEQWFAAGDMDFYNVESMVRCSNGDLMLALLVSKITGGTLIGPEQTIMVRIDPAGTVKSVGFFPVVHLAALVPLSGGRVAFRCSASDITWTGVGIMDLDFNWKWFKKAGFGVTPFLPNIIGQELAVSGDENRISGIFYTSGGEKIALTFDTTGNLLQQEIYFAGAFAQLAASAPDQGYVRASGIRSDAFVLTQSHSDGTAFDDCFFPFSCGLQLGDTILTPQPIAWQNTPADCLQDASATSSDFTPLVTDYCVNPDPMDAGFQMSDTVICAGSTVGFQRMASLSPPYFGLSEWTFEGGIPNRASEASVGNVRFNQPGHYTMRHIFTVAGCADTAVATLRVVSPPVLELGPDAALCPGDTLVLDPVVYPGATYQWNIGVQEMSIGIDQPGFYSLTITQQGTCTASDGIEVRILDAADIYLGPDTFLCPGATLRLSAPAVSEAYALRWSTGDMGSAIDIVSPGFYSLEMDAGNCSFLDTIIVHAANCNACEVYAPSVFMPESTSGGDMFQLFPGCPILTGNWRIYDRWGDLLFESDDLNQAWDGRLNGKKMPPGVYLYDAVLQLAPLQQPAEWRRLSGNFTLIR